MHPTLGDLGEEAMLDHFAALPRSCSTLVGPGDDCAVIPGPPARHDLLLKADALVESVHFTPDTPPTLVGRKALARVVSDFAAMGGRPDHFLVTLALRADTPWIWVTALYDGMLEAAREWGAALAGGETTRMPPPGANVISIAASGHAETGNAILRSGGRPGDVLAVTGRLGNSFASDHHLNFTPRLAESAWLSRHAAPTAMIDLSDGLGKDLPRLARASGCAFTLDLAALPLSPGADVARALGDGEDYELLLAIPPDRWPETAAAWPAAFLETPLTAIGRLLASDDPAATHIPVAGWDHFNSL